MKLSTNQDQAGIIKEVTDRFTDLVGAINQKDAGAWEQFYSNDEFDSAVAGGTFFATRSDWVQAITANFSMREKQELTVQQVQVIPVSTDTVLLTSQNQVTMQLKNGQNTISKHIFTMLWEKGPEGWQIIHSHESWMDE